MKHAVRLVVAREPLCGRVPPKLAAQAVGDIAKVALARHVMADLQVQTDRRRTRT